MYFIFTFAAIVHVVPVYVALEKFWRNCEIYSFRNTFSYNFEKMNEMKLNYVDVYMCMRVPGAPNCRD